MSKQIRESPDDNFLIGKPYGLSAAPNFGKIVLFHRAWVTGGETLGSAITFEDDTESEIPVVWLGPGEPDPAIHYIIVKCDDRLFAWTGVHGQPYMTCTPCNIPKKDLFCRFFYMGADNVLSQADFTLAWNEGMNLWIKYYGPNTFPNDYQTRYGAVNPTHRFELRCGDISGGPNFAVLTGALVRHWFYNGSAFPDNGPPTTPTKFNSNMSWARMFSTATRTCSPFMFDTSTFEIFSSSMGVNDKRIIVSEDVIP